MLDIRWIRENPEALDKALAARAAEPVSATLIDLDAKRRSVQTEMQEVQTRRNEASKLIGAAKSRGEDAQPLMDEVSGLKERLQQLEQNEKAVGGELTDLLATIPNIPAEDVSIGEDEDDNVELRRIGEPRQFDFEPLDHVTIGEKLGQMSFDASAKLSGSRFVVLSGGLARLERALADFMLDLHTTEYGYREVSPPVLVRDETVFGTGQLPKFAEDLFKTTDGLWLIPTAEVPLTNLVADEILDESALPMRFTAHTLCFRSEAGAAGRDTRGMLRQHQFYKVELVSIVHPDQSEEEHERMTRAAEEVLKRLELPYRVMNLSTGDLGFSARRTYDLEVWLPGQDLYREISSCSTCGDFQARRMRARYRPEGEKGTRFVHTLNGSGVAVGRAMIAVLENYQNEDGSVTIPQVLRPYIGGLEVLRADGA